MSTHTPEELRYYRQCRHVDMTLLVGFLVSLCFGVFLPTHPVPHLWWIQWMPLVVIHLLGWFQYWTRVPPKGVRSELISWQLALFWPILITVALILVYITDPVKERRAAERNLQSK